MNKLGKILVMLALVLGSAAGAKAQGALYHDIAWRYTPAGAFPAGGATITLCTSTATGAPCSPTINVYADAALSQPVSNPLAQCTSSGQTGCADNLGNFSFYVASGSYSYSVTGAGLTPYGPIPFQAGISTGIPVRLQTIGTLLSSGDFTFSGWGTGATLGSFSGSDSSFTFTVTAGTSPSLNPTITLTYHDGPWTAVTSVTSVMTGGSGSFADFENTGNNSLSALTMTYMGLPVAAQTYTVSVVVIGRSNLTLSSSLINPVILNPTGFQQIVGFGLGVPSLTASGLSTFSAGITGTGNIGGLDLGSGALGAGHSWTGIQLFPVGSIPINNLAPCSNGQYIQTIAGVQSCANSTFAVTVDGVGTTTPLNLSSTSPAAPSGYLNAKWQYSAGNASAALPISGTGGTVCSVVGGLTPGHLVAVDANGNCVDGGPGTIKILIDNTGLSCSGDQFVCTKTLNWSPAWLDGNYTAQCIGTGATPTSGNESVSFGGQVSQTASAITISIVSNGTSGGSFAGFVCWGIHN